MTKLLGLDFEIQYRLGLENKDANALFRIEPAISFLEVSIPGVLQMDEVKKAITEGEN